MKYEEFTKRVSAGVSLKENEFSSLKQDLIEKFLGEYDGEVIE